MWLVNDGLFLIILVVIYLTFRELSQVFPLCIQHFGNFHKYFCGVFNFDGYSRFRKFNIFTVCFYHNEPGINPPQHVILT